MNLLERKKLKSQSFTASEFFLEDIEEPFVLNNYKFGHYFNLDLIQVIHTTVKDRSKTSIYLH